MKTKRTPTTVVTALMLALAGSASADLVAHWRLDEGSGRIARDASGNGIDGILINAAEFTTDAVVGSHALVLDSSRSQYVDFGNPPRLPAGRLPRSLCGWAKIESVGAGYGWIAAYGMPQRSSAMFIGRLGDNLVGGGYWGDDLLESGFWEVGVWHHICLTYDGSTARLYADGVEVASEEKNWDLALGRAHIGRQVNDAPEFWDGVVDDVRIYNHALRAAEVLELANSTSREPMHLLHLVNTPPFDPLQEQAQIPDDFGTEDARGYYVLQFRECPNDRLRSRLAPYGVDYLGYIPDHAFVVRMSEETKAQLERLPAVRSVVIFHPAYRISPSLMGRYRGLETLEDRSPASCLVNVNVFDDIKGVQWAIQEMLADSGELILIEDADILQVFCPIDFLREIACLPNVRWIEEKPQPHQTNDVATGIINADVAWVLKPDPSGSSTLTGKNQVIAVADTGLDTGVNDSSMHDDIERDQLTILDYPVQKGLFISNAGASDTSDDRNTGHGTHVTGTVLGNGSNSSGKIKGVAYDADLVFQAVEQETVFLGSSIYDLSGIPSDLKKLFGDAFVKKARIHNNSWSDENTQNCGEYTGQSRSVDSFMWDKTSNSLDEMLIVFGAGNKGADLSPSDSVVDEGSVTPPSTAKNCVTVGASENDRGTIGVPGRNTYFDFKQKLAPGKSRFPTAPLRDDKLADNKNQVAANGGRGPTSDGRIKPDIVAPGTFVLSTRSSKTNQVLWAKPSSVPGAGYPSGYDGSYTFGGGTSMAAPFVSGAAALIRQYLQENQTHKIPHPSAALVKAILINGAEDMGGSTVTPDEPVPNTSEGWGRIDLKQSLTPPPLFHDVKPGIVYADDHEFTLTVGPSSGAVKITLVWTDYPAQASGAKDLVNDLDLEVIGPLGTTHFYGNDFKNGWSVAATATTPKRDTLNNVECVYIEKAVAGQYKCIVRGTSVPYAPQPYAIVACGNTVSFKTPAPFFSVGVLPYTRTIPAGASAEYSVKVLSNFGWNKNADQQVNLHVSSPDPSITVTASKTLLQPPAQWPFSDESILSLVTQKDTAPAVYDLDVTAIGGTIVESAQPSLVVRAVDAIAVWQHGKIVYTPDPQEVWRIWYSVWDSTAKVWWTHTGQKAAPIWVDATTDALEINDRDPAIAFDRGGNAVAAWSHERPDTKEGDVWCSRWTPSGLQWGWHKPEPVAELAGQDTDPALAIDTDGRAIVIWVHANQSSTDRLIYYSLWDKDVGWSSAVPLVPLSSGGWQGEASLPEIAFTSNSAANPKSSPHQAVAIWTDVYKGTTAIVGATLYSIWDGSAWYDKSGKQKVAIIPYWTGWPYHDANPQPQATHRNGLSVDNSGHAWVVWTTRDSASYAYPVEVINYAQWGGAAWDIKATTSKDQSGLPTNLGQHPAAAYNLFGTAITTYSCDTAPRDIRYFYDQDSQIVGAQSNSGDPYYRPAIAALPDDNVLAVWWCDQKSPPYQEGEIWFSRSTAPEKHWVQEAPIMDPSGPPYLNDRNPAVASPTGSPTMPPASYP